MVRKIPRSIVNKLEAISHAERGTDWIEIAPSSFPQLSGKVVMRRKRKWATLNEV
jgi:hypothetical protein